MATAAAAEISATTASATAARVLAGHAHPVDVVATLVPNGAEMIEVLAALHAD